MFSSQSQFGFNPVTEHAFSETTGIGRMAAMTDVPQKSALLNTFSMARFTDLSPCLPAVSLSSWKHMTICYRDLHRPRADCTLSHVASGIFSNAVSSAPMSPPFSPRRKPAPTSQFLDASVHVDQRERFLRPAIFSHVTYVTRGYRLHNLRYDPETLARRGPLVLP